MKALDRTTLRSKLFILHPYRSIFSSIGQLWTKRSEFQKEQAKFGRDRNDSFRAEYEKEVKERTESKLNWNIKNRWEQRQLDDILKNQDVKSIRFRDYTKLASQDSFAKHIQSFSTVDEIYYFMDTMFVDGFTEKHLTLALDVFLRDAALFEEKDLQSNTFQ